MSVGEPVPVGDGLAPTERLRRGGPLVTELRYVLRHSRSVQIGLAIVVLLLLAGLLAPLLTSYAPDKIDLSNTLKPPSHSHLLDRRARAR